MPFTRLALLLCYVLVAAGLTVFLFAQMQPQGQAASGIPVLLPLAMLAGLLIRALHKRLNRDDP
ncbi:hypothetical protein [uncultured Litoreibacter sp.]|uniref:hypothetical protein n=1 Tax=uncultured Litoreibacter sp. TaxID=1392394 RepID=UPI002630BDF1|nr:hypothetical protein [uncultured Litoreibacter sp.]